MQKKNYFYSNIKQDLTAVTVFGDQLIVWFVKSVITITPITF